MENNQIEPTQITAVVHVRPDADPRITALYEEGVKLEAYAVARVIHNDDDVKATTDDLSVIAGVKKAVEAKRVEYTGPLNDHLRTINDAFRRFTDPLVRADKANREKVLAYRAEQERIRQEQERINQLRQEAARAEMQLKGELSEPVGLLAVRDEEPTRYRTDTGTLGTAKKWCFEVVSFGALPDDYKVADMVKIRKVIIAGATIPGVRAWQEDTLRVTTHANA